jgi:import inner membrane translocase subunit TIM44
MLENDIPIILMDFNTQELLLFKNSKGEIVLGKEDHIEHVRYRVVFTKDQCVDSKIPLNPRTKGWRCQECIKIDSWSGI